MPKTNAINILHMITLSFSFQSFETFKKNKQNLEQNVIPGRHIQIQAYKHSIEHCDELKCHLLNAC